jgi:hypothetical protein
MNRIKPHILLNMEKLLLNIFAQLLSTNPHHILGKRGREEIMYGRNISLKRSNRHDSYCREILAYFREQSCS